MVDSPTRILLIDDGETYARMIAHSMPEVRLQGPDNGTSPPRVTSGPEAIDFLASAPHQVDVVLLDMNFNIEQADLFPLGGITDLKRTRRFQGVAILGEIRKRFPGLPVVLLTQLADLSLVDGAGDLASESMTYVLDGYDLDTLRIRISRALADAAQDQADGEVLWGRDEAMRAVRRRLQVMALGQMPIILEGETGCGKSYLAERYIHQKSGRSGPFVVLDLSTVPENLISAHLFGTTRGAYTGAVEARKGVFELANQGTLFIDEVQNAPLEVQKQLLLVLQDRKVRPLGASNYIEVDVKVVVATNRPLDEAVRQGTFRQDLYMRLSPATGIVIPPLRKRKGDLAFFSERMVARAVEDRDIRLMVDKVAARMGLGAGAKVRFSVGPGGEAAPDEIELVMPRPAWNQMTAHYWPGNLRELNMLFINLITFTLVDTMEAVRSDVILQSNRLQVDPGLVGKLLAGARRLVSPGDQVAGADAGDLVVKLQPAETLNEVTRLVERQYFEQLYHDSDGDFSTMAERLLGDATRARAVRLRFNQLGLKVREME